MGMKKSEFLWSFVVSKYAVGGNITLHLMYVCIYDLFIKAIIDYKYMATR